MQSSTGISSTAAAWLRPSGLAAGGEAAGLVTYKTSLGHFVNLSEPAKAERRIKRLRRSVWASGHLHGIADDGFESEVPWIVTPTYVGIADWRSNHTHELQRLGGWKTLSMVERYAHVAPEGLQIAAGRLDNALRGYAMATLDAKADRP